MGASGGWARKPDAVPDVDVEDEEQELPPAAAVTSRSSIFVLVPESLTVAPHCVRLRMKISTLLFFSQEKSLQEAIYFTWRDWHGGN
jgi:hypothetical protein